VEERRRAVTGLGTLTRESVTASVEGGSNRHR
jgi:hypothetical protein